MKLLKIAATVAFAAAALPASAGWIIDSYTSDVMVVFHNGYIVDHISMYEPGNGKLPSEPGTAFFGVGQYLNQNMWGDGKSTVVKEPEDNTVSDVFGVARFADGSGGYTYALGFASDYSGMPLVDMFGAAPTSSVMEQYEADPIKWFDVTAYLDPNLIAQGYTAIFASSDLLPGTHIPEPVSLALVGLAGLASAFARRRQV